MSTLFTVKSDDAPSQPPDVMPYALHGPLFFGAVNKIESLPDELPSGIAAVVLDATDLLSIDSSGIAALENAQRTLDRSGTRLFLVNANARCSEAVRRAGLDGLLAQEGARRP